LIASCATSNRIKDAHAGCFLHDGSTETPSRKVWTMQSLLALLLLTTAATAQSLPGFDRLTIDAPHRARPLEAMIWYPAAADTFSTAIGADAVFVGTMVQMGPAVQADAHPLVIISHGSGGNIANLGWLAEGLVARGAIVAGVNHPGATSGDSSPRQVLRVIDRTQDMAALLGMLTDDPAFAAAIDPTRITALGFSLGGLTALAAGGVRLDADAIGRYCDTFGAEASECMFITRGGVDPHALPPEVSADMTVPGLDRIIAVDPSLSRAFSAESLADLPPVHLIRMGTEAVIPPARDIGPLGSNLAARIPGATFTTISPAWHFSFLGLCTADAPKILVDADEDPICDDPAGTDRAAAHAQVIADVALVLGL
jgi:predicted dienelactone hydrolase